MMNPNEEQIPKAVNRRDDSGKSIPAKLEDTLIIRSNAVLVSKARMQFFQSAINQKNDTLICEGLVEVCYFDSNKKKPKAFPESLLVLFR